jgi:hypothetical protein
MRPLSPMIPATQRRETDAVCLLMAPYLRINLCCLSLKPVLLLHADWDLQPPLEERDNRVYLGVDVFVSIPFLQQAVTKCQERCLAHTRRNRACWHPRKRLGSCDASTRFLPGALRRPCRPDIS